MTEVNLLLKKIVTTFPGTAWSRYNYLDEGWDHAVIILDNRLVFRFPLDDEYRLLLANEIQILKQIRPYLRAAIPTYNHVANDGSFAGYPIVHGQQLSVEVLNLLAAEDRTQVINQLANFLSSIHKLTPNELSFDLVQLSDMAEKQLKLKILTPKLLRNVLTVTEYLIIESILSEMDELLTKSIPSCFIHVDIYRNHLLWDGSKSQLGIIDFSDMNIGDPAFDFAELYEYDRDFVEQVYSAYTGPRDSDFLERAWIYQKWMAVYMLIDHFEHHKTSFKIARETFDRIQNQAY